MSQELNALIVEDSSEDAELILFKLFEAGYTVEHTLVDNASDLKQMLKEKPWDILFCDYSLPYLDPYMALEIIREFDIDIPLIVISGTIGEENAVELMRSGFHDCVMKNNLGKLPEVVSREIREASVRRENRILQKRIQKYQLLAEEISDAIFFIDVEGNILEANNAAIKNYGYSREEFLTKRIFELCGSNKEEIIFKEMEMGNREGIILETIHFRKDGSAMEVEMNSHGSLLEGKQILLSIVRDITARKFAENALIKSEKDYRTLVDNAPDIIARLDRSYRFVYFHNRSQIDLNIPTKLMIGKTFIDLGICDADYKKLENVIEWVFENKHEKSINFELATSTGTQYYNTIIVPELNKDGLVATVLSISRSVTETVLAQKAMAASLAKYRKLLDGIVTALSAVVEVRDPYTSGHQNRVSKLATTMAILLDLDEDAVETVRITGLLHDIGKMYVPTELLVKPTTLSSLEYEIIKIHSEAGYNILKSVDFTGPIAEIVYQHHERMDGSGYPRKFKTEQILMEARIISVADVVEAMMSHRPYRPAKTFDEALAEIERGSGTIYDRDCVQVCLNLFRNKGYQL